MTDTTLQKMGVEAAADDRRVATAGRKEPPARGKNIALVHDYLTQRGGAERVVLSMLKAFPTAPVHTSLYHAEGTFPEFGQATVRTFGLDRFSMLREHHRFALPFLASSFGRHHVDADVVICSSSGWAHGASTGGRKIVYCYSPARWLYDGHRYLGEHHGLVSKAFTHVRPTLLRWDQRAAATANRYLTLSVAVQQRIKAVYGIEAEVVHPPPGLGAEGLRVAVDGIEPGFLLCVSRLLPYKNVDAIVEAFSELPNERLVIVGAGPERSRIDALRGPNVTFLGSVLDSQLRWLYAASSAVVAASYEDYGLTPLEGAGFGKPSVVLRKGGFLETVVEDATGVFFDEPQPGQIARAIRVAAQTNWPSTEFRNHLEVFSEERFVQRLRHITEEEAAAR